MGVTEVATLSAKIENESRYWTGYDPNLIASLAKESKNLEKDYNYYKDEATTEKLKRRSYAVITSIVILGVLAFSFTIGYFTTLENKVRNRLRAEIASHMTDDDLMKIGFRKYESSYEIILIKRKN